MTMKDAYARKLQSQLDQWSAEVNKLQMKAHLAGEDAAWKIEKEAADLKWRLGLAQDKLDALKARGGHALDDLRASLERNWQSLDMSVKSAASRFG